MQQLTAIVVAGATLWLILFALAAARANQRGLKGLRLAGWASLAALAAVAVGLPLLPHG